MSLTREASQMDTAYEQAPRIIQDAVDDAYTAVRTLFVDQGFDVSSTDPAEELVAAIYKYLIDSAEAM